MTMVSSVRNWLRMKLCGEELLELASLKQKVSDMKVWCSHIPVARECGKWLEDSKSYPSQCRDSHGSIEDFRVYLEFESLKLNSRKSYIEGGRSSGRTFRSVLGAVLKCSEMKMDNPSTIYVIGKDANHCRHLYGTCLGVISQLNGTSVGCDEICLPNGSRLLFRSSEWMNENKRGIINNGQEIFIDHFLMEYDYDRK